MEWIPVLVIAVLALIVIVRNIYVVQQSRAYVVERLGAFSNVLSSISGWLLSGINWLIRLLPFFRFT